MKTILFSALFGASIKSERIRFLTEVKKAFPEPVRFVAFNTSGVVEAEFEVVNAASGFKPQVGDPMDYLRTMLQERFPEKSTLFMDHVRGEFGKNRKLYEASVYKIVRMIKEFERTLNHYAPDYVYLWNQFNAFHRILAAILTQRGIRFGFFHDGVLPGSIALDVDGEMGESWIARMPQKFLDIPVSEQDVERATAFLASLDQDSTNRHPQIEHISVRQSLQLAGLHDRPIVFLAGQNDWHSGIKPRSPDRSYHSHIFEGSVEALAAMDQIAGDLGVTILFKPHPLSKDKHSFLRQEEMKNSLILSTTSMQACLEVADLVATIASQTCYVALMAGKPVLMLGKNQITGKGLTYDAQTREDIPALIVEGVADPLATTRAVDFAHHAAQLERAYLFDYKTIETDFYRRGPSHAARYISASIEMPPAEVIDLQAAGAFS